MPNQFQVVDWLTMEGLRVLINKSQAAQFFNTDYNKEFTREFAVGETVRVKLPQRFVVRDGLGYTPQPIRRRYTTVTVDQIFGIDFEWDSVEAALKAERGMDQIKKEYLDPAMAQLANELDSRCSLFAYHNTNNITGVLGTTPTDLVPYRKARTLLNENACTPGERGLIFSPAMEEAAVAAGVAYFNPTSQISQQYKDGSLGKFAGFDTYSSNNLYAHTAGTWQSTVSVNGAGQIGSSLNINCTSGDTFKSGDVFSIDLVKNVNPVNRRSTGRAKTFVVTQDFTASASTGTIQISPAIEGPGSQYQNVDSALTDTAALTLWPGTSSPNGKSGINGLGLNRDAFALVGVKLETPKAVELASQTRDPATGIAVSFVRQFDGVARKMINRFDVLCGFGSLYADNCAVRIASFS